MRHSKKRASGAGQLLIFRVRSVIYKKNVNKTVISNFSFEQFN